MKTMKLSLALAMAGAVALAACAHERAADNTASSSMTPSPQKPGVTSMQGSGTSAGAAEMQYAGDDATVVERLATARCDHEAYCKHVGTGLAFASLFDCVSQVRKGMMTELDGFGCRGSLSGTGVGTCMATILVESCRQQQNDLAHAPQCRSTTVCASTPVSSQ